MTELKRSYPYPRQLLLNGVYDLTEGTGGKIQKLAEEGEILGEREVYGNKSTFLFALSGTEDSDRGVFPRAGAVVGGRIAGAEFPV